MQNWLEERIDLSHFDGLQIPTPESEDKIQLFVNPSKVIPQPHLQKLQPTNEPPQTVEAEDHAAVDLLQEFEDLFNSGQPEYEFQPEQLPEDLAVTTIDSNEFYSLIMQESAGSSPQASYTEDQTPFSSPHSSTASEEMPLPAWMQDYNIQLGETSDLISDSDDIKDESVNGEQEGNMDNCLEDVYIKDETVSSPESIDSPRSVDSATTNSDPDWSASSGKTTTKRKSKVGYTRKPYMRVPPEQRKDRKKEQNKNAATRYRQKKKQEFAEIAGEEGELVERNNDLKEKATDLEREIKYLKNLLRDLYKAKGLIK